MIETRTTRKIFNQTWIKDFQVVKGCDPTLMANDIHVMYIQQEREQMI